jgi:hypothetical protein
MAAGLPQMISEADLSAWDAVFSPSAVITCEKIRLFEKRLCTNVLLLSIRVQEPSPTLDIIRALASGYWYRSLHKAAKRHHPSAELITLRGPCRGLCFTLWNWTPTRLIVYLSFGLSSGLRFSGNDILQLDRNQDQNLHLVRPLLKPLLQRP